ncbi:MAG TPA: hypothetical protein VN782_11335 [Usitatibacter sp.]|nr:hypothetical protein [Usitatibacter sp.]
MDLAQKKQETLSAEDSHRAAAPITQLRELELALIGGGMGDVQQ